MLRKLFPTLFLLCAVLVLGPGIAHSQAAIDSIVINSVDSSDFPQVAVRFRPLDSHGNPIPNLSLNAIQVTEDGDAIIPERLDPAEEGLWIHFVIDAGAGIKGEPERWPRAQSVITNFVTSAPGMKENLDHVALSVVEPSGLRTLVNYTTSPQEVTSALNDYRLPEGFNFSSPMPALESILRAMDREEAAQGQAKFIIFITSGIENGSRAVANLLISQARNVDIPVFTTLVRTSPRLEENIVGTIDQPPPEPRDELLRYIAEGTGSAFTHYRNSGDMDDVYREMIAQRQRYDVIYRSKSGISGTRQVQLRPVGGAASDPHSYTVEVNPPRALIETPRDGQIIERKSNEYVADRSVLNPASHTIVSSVVFPDNHTRRLERATLYVNGEVATSRDKPSNDFELTWDLRPVQASGMNDFTLEVVVEDELGLEATSPPVSVKVDVFVPPQPTPQTEVETIIERVLESAATPTPIPCISPDPICVRLERPVRTEIVESPTSAVSMAIATASLIFAGLVYVNRDKAPVVAARNTVLGAVERLTNRYKRSEPIAYLEVLKGDSNVGMLLEIYGDTPIGRARQVGAELLFHQDDDNSPISRLHCTILNEEDHFMIRDEDSANGTFLNGAKLEPLVPEPLNYDDKIQLARVERGGVLLQFRIAEDGPMAEDLRETRQTRAPKHLDDEVDEEPENRF